MDEAVLEFDLDELEEVKKLSCESQFDYPVVYVGSVLYFNKASSVFMNGVQAIKWFVTPEYVVGIPARKGTHNSFLITKTDNKSGGSIYYARFPVSLREEKKLKQGIYKLLKCKNGFAFRRYEPIEEQN